MPGPPSAGDEAATPGARSAGDELDVADARRRLNVAAEEAKRLEEAGRGPEAHAAWDRYELIRGAIEAQERTARATRRFGG